MTQQARAWRTRLPRPSRAFLVWFAVIGLIYVAATAADVAVHRSGRIDVPMKLAVQLTRGQLALPDAPPVLDAVTRDGQAFHVAGLGVVLPYLPFVPFGPLWPWSAWIVSLAFGLLAAALAWPLAVRYGPGGHTTVWLATLTALGTLLLPMANQGNFYYTAHVVAMAFTLLALVELAGARRAWVIGGGLALAALARPTVLLAAIPIGAYLLWRAENRRAAVAAWFVAPLALVVLLTGAYDWAKFGSPLETGYAEATLKNPVLQRARDQGVFSVRHVANNLAVLIGKGFAVRPRFPYLVPSNTGLSILVTTPAVIAAVNAGWRDATARVFWIATGLILIPLLLYYGGAGYVTYGYRYALDLMPFVLALIAIGARRQFGGTEKLLIILSIAVCQYGVLWGIVHGHY